MDDTDLSYSFLNRSGEVVDISGLEPGESNDKKEVVA